MEKIRILILLGFILSIAPATAEVPPADASPWDISIALGYGERSNPLINSDDLPIVVNLDIGWFGKRFFFDNGDFGYTLHDGNRLTLNSILRLNSDRLFFTSADIKFVSIGVGPFGGPPIEVPVDPPSRDYAIEAGIELLSDGRWGRAQLALFHDVSKIHRGFDFSGQLVRGFRKQRWYLESSIGFSFKNSQMNDYYWGITPLEQNNFLTSYKAEAGLNKNLRISLSYQINRHWAAVGTWQSEWLSDEVVHSPIVKDSSVSSQYFGLQYVF